MRTRSGSVAIAMALFVGTPASATPAEIWAGACAYCHDAGVAPPIFGLKLPRAALATVVRNGSNGMPAFHPSEISDAQLQQLADWIARQRPAKPVR
jgi:mono/diheme cytochrome c family protein